MSISLSVFVERSTPIPLGCFEDTAVRDLSGLMVQTDANSQEYCSGFCYSNGEYNSLWQTLRCFCLQEIARL